MVKSLLVNYDYFGHFMDRQLKKFDLGLVVYVIGCSGESPPVYLRRLTTDLVCVRPGKVVSVPDRLLVKDRAYYYAAIRPCPRIRWRTVTTCSSVAHEFASAKRLAKH